LFADDAGQLREQVVRFLLKSPAPSGQRDDGETREVSQFQQRRAFQAEMQSHGRLHGAGTPQGVGRVSRHW
jgi:hypothetical protein